MMKVIYEATKKAADGQELSQESYLKTFLLFYFVRFPCKGKYLAKCKQYNAQSETRFQYHSVQSVIESCAKNCKYPEY